MIIHKIKTSDYNKPYLIVARNEDNNLLARIKWDGCVNLYKYTNGDTPDNYSYDNVDYFHICEVKEFIKELQSIVDIAENTFNHDDFENYWN